MPLVSGEFTAVADPELKFTGGGVAMARIRGVYSDRKRDANGTWQDGPSQFISVTCMGKQAEMVCESICARNASSHRTPPTAGAPEWRWRRRTGHRLFVSINGSIGPSLRFATAKTEKALEGSGSVRAAVSGLGASAVDPWAQKGAQAAQQTSDDPWAAQSDEPPF